MTVVIDPGHGGKDPGAVVDTVREKALALQYALALGGELCLAKIPVLFTRTTDALPGGGDDKDAALRYRANLANTNNADAFVSVHFNAGLSQAVSGLWLLYAENAEGGKALALAIQRKVGGAIHPDNSGWTGDRKLAVLRRTRMPAVLIEYGFLTHPGERARLLNVEYMRVLVAQTSRGIIDWLASRQ